MTLLQVEAAKVGSEAEVRKLLDEGEDPNSHEDNKVITYMRNTLPKCAYLHALSHFRVNGRHCSMLATVVIVKLLSFFSRKVQIPTGDQQ